MPPRATDYEPLAIVGIGCAMPGNVTGARQFWRLFADGRCGIGEIPQDRWSHGRFYDPDPTAIGKSATKWAGIVAGIRDFDAEFFGISPAEAEAMDPQQRLLLTAAWEAFEDAGAPPERLAGSNAAVFVGVSGTDYTQAQRFRRTGENVYAGTGGAMSIVANRLSHKFDFRGPSMAVDTACSSSLVATDLACHAIWRGQSDVALAAGVNALLDPGVFVNFSKANMMSRTGRIRTFDAAADGYVRGEGVGVVVIKRLGEALAEGDRVYAVIRATCVNQDGHTSTITVPNAEAQHQMLRQACARAGLAPADIDFVEAHGTGTPVGDPIEASAIGTAFGQVHDRRRPVIVGAGKTNTGHLESAAGITGLIKTALALHHRQIPRNLFFNSPNPNIALDDLRLDLPLQHRDWAADTGRPRRGAINSFGFGGTNACAVLEEAPAGAGERPAHSHPYGRTLFLPLGAQSGGALRAVAGQTAEHLRARSDRRAAAAVAANMAVRRSHLSERAGVLAKSPDEAIALLKRLAKSGEAEPNLGGIVVGRRLNNPRLVMAFSGQGGAWWGMGHGLMRADPVFAATVEEIDRHFQPLAGWSIAAELLRPEKQYRGSSAYSLPCLFALQAGLVARWREWGVVPAMVLGHSSGEMAAAYAAGILSLADAVGIVHARAQLQATQEGRGAIAAVALSRAAAESDIEHWGLGHLDIAAINGPAMVNIAGDTAEIDRAVVLFKEKYGEDFFARRLHIDFAPHCHHMDPIRDAFAAATRQVAPMVGNIPMISTVTGHLLAGQMVDAGYWWRNIRDPVQFDRAVREAMRLGGNVFLEIGPHANVAPMIAAIAAERAEPAALVTSLRRDEEHDHTLMRGLAALFVAGVEPDWRALHGAVVPRADLPPYPWEKKPFWIESEEARAALFGDRAHPLLGERVFGPVPLWKSELSLDQHRFLLDHTIDGSVVFPATGFLEIMFAAGRELFGEGAIELENVEILDAMVLSNERTELLQTSFEPARGRVSIHSRTRGSNLDWVLRARAIVRGLPGEQAPPRRAVKPPRRKPIAGREIYKRVAARGYAFGKTFQGMRKLWDGNDSALALVAGRGIAAADYQFHPALLDAALHAGFGLNAARERDESDLRLYLPVRIERVLLRRSPGSAPFYSQARSVLFDQSTSINDFAMVGADGEAILEIEGFTARAIMTRQANAATATALPRLVVEDWVETAPKLAAFGKSGRGKPGRGQTWLVFAAQGGGDIGRSLRDAGARIIAVEPGQALRKLADGRWTIRPDQLSDMAALLAGLVKAKQRKLAGIVFAWALDGTSRATALDDATLRTIENKTTVPVLHLARALGETPALKPRLWLVTQGAFAVGGEQASERSLASALAGAPLAGMARTVLTEYPDLHCSLVDLAGDRADMRRQAGSLAGLLLGQTDESEIALRGEAWFVPRLHMVDRQALVAKRAPAHSAEGDRAYKVAIATPGDLDDLRLVEAASPAPGKGEIKIAIKAGGLNFRDVMAATGLLPADAESGLPWQALGLECSGVVSALGPGVRGLRVGDRVMASARGVFASDAVVPALAAHKIPRGLSFVDAATLPSAFATAYFALHRLARLAKGETVLIHLGTGGVGLAAIQIAKLAGATIISTAGSPAKRAYLRKIGIKHVFDSRSLAFADQVRRATGGRGVDVVLNSLAGEAIPLALSLMAPNGRFVEIGKRDIYGDSALGLRALRRNVSVFVLDMARMDRDDPKALAEVYGRVLALFAAKRLKPLPALVFPAERAADAFKAMAQARHIGKVVVDFSRPAPLVDLSVDLPVRFSATGGYIIAGGLGGFGAEVARWMASRGARQLYLIGRSGPDSAGAAALLKDLAKRGARAVALAADITKRADVDRVMAHMAKDGVAARGVIHSAMVLDDGFINQLDGERMHRVLAPKALGAWNLHLATRKSRLDFFVLFSSMASTIGSAGQANYVAANRFLDLFAAHRRGLGLPATAINWGSLGGAGAVQRNKAILKYLKTMGMPPLELEEAFAGLETILRADAPALGFCKIDWQALARANPTIAKTPRLAEVAGAAKGKAGGRIRSQLTGADAAGREALLRGYVAHQIARVLKIDEKSLDLARPLNELGLDSLTSFQLKNKIEGDVGISLPVGKFLQKPTVDSLVVTINGAFEASLKEGKGAAADAAAGAGESLPLSPRQHWLWRRLQEDGPARRHGNIELIYALRINVPVDGERLERAWRQTLLAHPVLRSAFPAVQGEPTVSLLPLGRMAVQRHDATGLDAAALEARLRALANTPHDLQAGPLIDLHIFDLSGGSSVLVLRSHIMLTDGWSLTMLLRDIFQAYFGLPAPAVGAADSPATNSGYFEYAKWHRGWVDGPEGKKARDYWRDRLADLPRPPKFTPCTAGPVDLDAKAVSVRRTLSADAAPPVRETARTLGVSLHALMAAAFDAAVHGASGARDLALVTNFANRLRPGDEAMIGWLANQIFVRVAVEPAHSLKQHAAQVAQAMAEASDHAGYPAHLMLEAAAESNNGTVAPHFVGISPMWPDNALRTGFERIMFSPPGTAHNFGGVEVSLLPVGVDGMGQALQDAQLVYQEVDGDLLLTLYSRDGVFAPGQAEAFLGRYLRMLAAACADPAITIAALAAIA